MRTARMVVACVALAFAQCHQRTTYEVVSGPRDWTAHPAIVEIDPQMTIYAISDVHGGYDRMVTLLTKHGVIAATPASPADVQWAAGDAILVVAGDLIDKGPSPLEVIDLLRALETSAAATFGRVVVTFGNHEAEFFYDPGNDKASASDGVDEEILTRGWNPISIANGRDPRGKWLRDRPFGVRVGRWFFSHAGDTHGRTIPELEQALRPAIEPHNFDDPEAIGDNSILESRGWYSDDSSIGARYAAVLGAQHIVFGHEPSALGPGGSIAVAQDGALFRIDCGMSPDVNDSDGHMLRVRVDAGYDIAESLDADGSVHEIWRGSVE